MQINAAQSGLYPAPLPATRKPAGESVDGHSGVSTATEVRVPQPVAPVPSVGSAELSRGVLQARQRGGFAGVVNDAGAGQRAVAVYAAVAEQEQRSVLNEVLAGIDLFV
ncbi:MAG TPA: hypothetical protein ENI97_14405 [Gammaproteobacteria bacterium]|nr:hypothetical protein [Gammaproteobacteria bacterium]